MNLLEELEFILERRRAPTHIMYHGTSTRFLRSIKKQGLIPKPPKKVWQEDPSGYDRTRVSLDSVYFTSNFMTAISSSGNAIRKFGGKRLIVIAKIQPRSAFADEDSLNSSIDNGMRKAFGYVWSERPGVYYPSMLNSVTKKKRIKEFIHGFKKAIVIRMSGSEKIPISDKTAEEIIVGTLEYLISRQKRRDEIRSQIRTGVDKVEQETRNELTRERFNLIVNNIIERLPSRSEAERKYLSGVDQLTRSFKKIANPRDKFLHTLRMDEPVNYSGVNKIMAIVTPYNDEEYNSYFIVHYGKVPREAISDSTQGWFSKKPQIITYKEAVQKGFIK